MKSLLIVLIHNNDANRLEKTRPSIKELIQSLRNKLTTKYIEIYLQPDRKQHTVIVSFFRELYYNILGIEWTRYRQKSKNVIIFWVKASIYLINKYIFSPTVRKQWQKSSIIEHYVTSKHIKAWETSVLLNNDYLLVFEDDVYFNTNSIAMFNDYIVSILQNNTDEFLYIDLAGGCQINELQIDNLFVNNLSSLNTYSKPVTNTACCYLINLNLAKHFVNEITNNPLLRTIGVDWLMNKLFIILDKRAQRCTCFHADPTIFQHGSTTGIYKPWQR